ncbi:MAG: hypothetical protein JWO56_3551 [Acidobacteria bacterium]|nr:hypothetical protein [Acidobacteriota bacterium]
MRALTADDVLTAAERLRAEPPARRGAAMLALATGMARDDAMALPVGERDDRLLALRIATFGRELTGVADCPRCGTLCETTLDASALRLESGDSVVEVEHDGWRVRARLPNSEDVALAAGETDPGRARHLLLARCIVDRSPDTQPPDEVAAALEEALEQEMERADPRGDIALVLSCPQCSATWSAAFDIGGFLWTEIGAAARRLVDEVDVLARAYGWSERDILQLPAGRRHAYIEKIVE